jgi:hypothetical protein
VAGGPAGSVIAGIAVGTGFIVMFALFAPLLPARFVQVPPAPISLDDDATPVFGEITNLTNSEGDSAISDIVMGGAIYVLWSEEVPVVRPRINETYEIFVAHSIEGDRAVFGRPYNLSNTSSLSGNPTLTVFENQFSVIWYEVTGGAGNTEILYRWGQDVSGPPGEFDETKNLSNTPHESEYLDVFALDNNIYAAWREFPLSNPEAGTEILFRASMDSGRAFENPVGIIKGLDYFACPKIAASGNNVYVSWLAYNSHPEEIPEIKIMFATSSDGGLSFGEPIELAAGEVDCPEIAASGQNVHVTWSGTADVRRRAFWQEPSYTQHVYVRTSHDAGEDFDQTIRLSSISMADSIEPKIAIAGDYLLIVWRGTFLDAIGPTADVFLARSEDGGYTFSRTVNLNNSLTASWRPQLEVFSHHNYVHVVWLEGNFSSDQSQIMLRRSLDWGATFGNSVALTEPIYVYGWPVVATDYNGRTYVGWSAYRDPDEPFSDVFLTTTPQPYGYLVIGRYGVDVIQSRAVRDLVRQAFADPDVASLLNSGVHNVLIENNFEGYDGLPDTLTVIVIGDRTVQGDWQMSYTITDSGRQAIVIKLDKDNGRHIIGSIEIQPLKDRVDVLTFDKTRKEIIAIAMKDGRFTSLLEGKDAYISHIREGVGASAGNCFIDHCAIVLARQVDREEFATALVNIETRKLVSVSKSAGW